MTTSAPSPAGQSAVNWPAPVQGNTAYAVPDAFYALWDSTGGMPPAACRAPTKTGTQARRVEASHRARVIARRRGIYEKTATTGFRPPEDCYAPVKAPKPVAPSEPVEDL